MADANLLHALKSIEDERFDDESLKDFIVAAREAIQHASRLRSQGSE